MNSKTMIGTLAGGVAFFLLGWLIYGFLLMDYMMANTNTAVWRQMEDMIWWAMILSNFIWAYFISMVFDWSNTSGAAQGMQRGLLLGLTTGLAIDIGMYSNTTYFNSLSAAFVDVLAICIMTTIVGAIIGMIRGNSKEEKTS